MDNSLNITCLCGKSKSTVGLAAEHPPANILMCHCNTCRYTSGVLCTTYLTIEPPPPQLASSLIAYWSSKTVERKFCGACGAHVLSYNSTSNKWNVTTGAIESVHEPPGRSIPHSTRAVRHVFVSDTIDGGLAPSLATNHEHELTYFVPPPDETPPTLASPPIIGQQDTPSSSPTGTLHASCHCGGVQFTLSRPNEKSTQLSSPWPDLLVPYHSHSPTNDQDVKWWLRHNATKYLAGACACRSCRLGSGFPIQTWAFVPRFNINMIVDGESAPLSFAETKMGTLSRFSSSPGKYREFCGRCGATVFWHCDERPDLIDVSVGLLRATEGARAETWLEWWTGRVSFKEDAVDKDLIAALEAGLRNITR